MVYDPHKPLLSAPPSLAEQKRFSLANKYAEKKEVVSPTPTIPVMPETPSIENLMYGDTQDTNLIDIGQASLARAGGNLADAGRGISNYLFNTNFDDSRDTGWSNPEVADEYVGVSPEYRQRMQADQNKVLESVAEGKYLDAFGNALNVAGRTAADSFATIPEVAAGAALTAVGGAGLPVLANKARKIFNTADNVKDSYKAVKKAKVAKEKIEEANRIGKALKAMKNLPAATAKAAGQASILATDLTQQQRAEYIEKYGEEPSGERLATMALTRMAAVIWQPGIMAKLFIPNFKKEIVKEGSRLASSVKGKSSLVNIAKRAGDYANRLVKAGAAESAQEYVETWQEIMAVDISPEEANNLMEAMVSRIKDKKFQDQAITGGMLGGVAGGVIKGTIDAPGLAIGTIADATIGTAKTAAKIAVGTGKKTYDTTNKGVQAVRNKTRNAFMNESERESIREDYNIRKAEVDSKKSEYDTKIDKVNKANTFEEMISEDAILARDVTDKMGKLDLIEDDLSNPSKMKKLKDAVTREYKARKTNMDIELEASNVAKVSTAIGKGIKSKAVETAVAAINHDLTKEAVERTVATIITAKKKAEVAIEAVREIKSSTALGIVEMGLNATPEMSKTVINAAKSLEPGDIKRVSKVISEKNPILGKELEKVYNRKMEYLKDLGQRRDDLINEENISPIIKDIDKKGTIEGQTPAAVAAAIKETMASRIENRPALEMMKKTLDIYKNSDAYKNKDTPGRISEKSITTLESRLKNAENRINREMTTDNVKRTVDSVKKTYKEKAPGVKKYIKETAEKWKGKVTELAESVSKATNDFAEALEGTKVLPEGSLQEKLDILSELLDQNPNQAKDLTQSIPNMVKAISEAGYKTESDLADLVKQFPGLAKSEQFYNELQSRFATDAIIEENTDNTESTPETPNKAFQFFKKLGLPECK